MGLMCKDFWCAFRKKLYVVITNMNNWKDVWSADRGSVDNVNFSDIRSTIMTLKKSMDLIYR